MSDYALELVDNVVLVIDLDLGGGSVTNDAEQVIQELATSGGNLDALVILYRDSEGRWDQIVTRHSQFVGFRMVGATSREGALAWGKERT